MKRAARLAVLALLAWLLAVFAVIWRGPAETFAERADFALVLGAAVSDDRPSPVFAARIDHGIQLWREGRASRIVFTGGVGEGDRVSEAAAGRAQALAAGVPAGAILIEQHSRTTQQNIANAAPLVAGGSVAVVSDPLHLTRAMAMAQDAGMNAVPAAARHSAYRTWRTKFPFALRELYFLHHYWLLGE